MLLNKSKLEVAFLHASQKCQHWPVLFCRRPGSGIQTALSYSGGLQHLVMNNNIWQSHWFACELTNQSLSQGQANDVEQWALLTSVFDSERHQSDWSRSAMSHKLTGTRSPRFGHTLGILMGFSFIFMTFDIAGRHSRHRRYEWTHVAYGWNEKSVK